MTHRKHVLSVAYPLAEVSMDAAGGAEQILAEVESAAIAAGYGSCVAAHAGSRVAGQLFPVTVPGGVLTEDVRRTAENSLQRAIHLAVEAHRPDLIHMHGLDFSRYVLPDGVPVLVTLHLPAAWYPESIWQLPSRYTLQCVSEHQRQSCPRHAQHRLVVVENGVALPANLDAATKRDYALLLSRICPEKNLHTAILAAKHAGMPVVLAGKLFAYPEHVAYFHTMIEPLLDDSVQFVGPVAGERKQQLLREARCLLIASTAEETSSLVAMEALSAGTPVIAIRAGALPTIVEDGTTGFLVNDRASMQAALARVHEIDPERCRAVARQRFSARRMTDRYMDLYERLMQ